jgi:hypothetical protein
MITTLDVAAVEFKWAASTSGTYERATLPFVVAGKYDDDPVGVAIERFYDRAIRLWTLVLVDDGGNQIGDAEYAVRKTEVDAAARDLIRKAIR